MKTLIDSIPGEVYGLLVIALLYAITRFSLTTIHALNERYKRLVHPKDKPPPKPEEPTPNYKYNRRNQEPDIDISKAFK